MHTSLHLLLALLLLSPACSTNRRSARGADPSGGGRDASGKDAGPEDGGPSGPDGGPVDGGPARDAGPDDVQEGVDATGPGTPDADAGGPAEDTGPESPDTGLPPICHGLPDPPEQPPLDLEARCRQAGEPLRIRDLRDPRCPDHAQLPDRFPGLDVVFEEEVVSAVYGDDFTVVDPDGGAYSGLWVYDPRGQAPEVLTSGTRLRLAGSAIEFYTLTEVSPATDGIEVLGQGPAPEPIRVTAPRRLGDFGDLGEPLESRLVVLENVRIDTTVPDCPRDFGMFVVTGNLRVDDEGTYDYVPTRGDVLTRLVGAVHYSFSHWKLLPRDDDDMTVVACGGMPDKCEASDCPVEPDADESGRLVVTEIQDNPEGDDRLREYLELYNPGPASVDVTGWRVQDCAGNGVVLEGVMAARTYRVLVAKLEVEENGGVQGDAVLGELFLPNGWGSVLVFDADGELVDQVRYAREEPWPSRFPGQSLELPEPAADNRDGAAWSWGRERYGVGGRGTPGGPFQE